MGDQLHSNELSAALPQTLLAFIEENAQVGAWSCELSSGTVYWSPQLYALLGQDPGRIVPGLAIFEQIIHPDDRATLGDRQTLELGGPVGDREFRIIRPNGAIRWLRSMGQILHRPNGAPWRAVGFTRDVTEEREARVGNAALEGTRQALRKLASGDIWVLSAWDNASEHRPWARAPHLPGRIPTDGMHPEDVTRVGAAWARALAERRPFRSAYRLGAGNGRYERYVSYAEPIEDELRRPLGWVGVTLPDAAPDTEMAPAKNIPGALLRAARGWLNYSVLELAERSGLSSSTIRRLEGGSGRQTTRDSEETLLRTFHEAGIDFYVDGSGMPQVRFAAEEPRWGSDEAAPGRL